MLTCVDKILSLVCAKNYVDISTDVNALIVLDCNLCTKNTSLYELFQQYVLPLEADKRPKILGLATKPAHGSRSTWLSNMACTQCFPESEEDRPQHYKFEKVTPELLKATPKMFAKRALKMEGLYLHTISKNGERTSLGLVTMKPLGESKHPIKLKDRFGKEVVMMIEDQVTVKLDEQQYRCLELFHILTLSITMRNAKYSTIDKLTEDVKLFLIAPVDGDNGIDWATVHEAQYLAKSQFEETIEEGTDEASPPRKKRKIDEETVSKMVAIPTYGTMTVENGVFEKQIFTQLKINPDTTLLSPFDDPRKFLTYADYYKKKYPSLKVIDENANMLDAHPILSAHNGMNPSSLETRTIRPNKIFPDFMKFFQLAHVFDDAIMLPSFLWGLEFSLLIDELQFKITSSVEGVEISPQLYDMLFLAATSKNSNMSPNNDVLECLGDNLMKLFYCTSLYVNQQNSTEGEMTDKKMMLVANKRFSHMAKEKNLVQYMLVENVRELSYTPPLLEPKVETKIEVSEKYLADFVEALLGAMFLHGGLKNASSFLSWLDPSFVPVQAMIKEQDNTPMMVQFGTASSEFELEKRYTFKDGSLKRSALGYSSDMNRNEFERLEFLGDAVLDYIVTCYFYQTYKEQATPSILTNARSNAVCNNSLAVLTVQAGLHELVDLDLTNNNPKYDEYIKQHKDAILDKNYCFQEIPTAPKLLGDIFEAYTGAILVDSNYDIRKVCYVLEPLLYNRLRNITLDRIVYAEQK